MDSLDFKVGELLKEIILDDSAIETLDRAVSSVVDAIESIPEQLVSADAAPKFVADLGVPTDKKLSFTFKSPESIQVGGSHSIRSVAKPDINVDLLVRMPKVRKEIYKRSCYVCTCVLRLVFWVLQSDIVVVFRNASTRRIT